MNLKDVLENIEKKYVLLDSPVSRMMDDEIDRFLSSTKMMYRIFHRTKSKYSLKDKVEKKYEIYNKDGRGVRDLYGVRIVLYFQDDIDICIALLNDRYEVVSKKHDKPKPEIFAPQRINYTFRLPSSTATIVREDVLKECFIECTFEVQIRTIFSEGWHEVDHDIRYKYMEVWKKYENYERELNGIFASLEVCNQAMLSICDRLAYDAYKNGDWNTMIRNRFRLRFNNKSLDEKICSIMDEENDVAKEIFRFERNKLVELLQKTSLPCIYDNVVFLINLTLIRDEHIMEITPEPVIRRTEEVLKKP